MPKNVLINTVKLKMERKIFIVKKHGVKRLHLHLGVGIHLLLQKHRVNMVDKPIVMLLSAIITLISRIA